MFNAPLQRNTPNSRNHKRQRRQKRRDRQGGKVQERLDETSQGNDLRAAREEAEDQAQEPAGRGGDGDVADHLRQVRGDDSDDGVDDACFPPLSATK